MNLNQLYYFNQVAKLGHMTKAAQALYISQPSLSYAMSRLENELGVPLFEHRGRQIQLTVYGQKLYEYTQPALTMLEEGMQMLTQMACQEQSEIQIACINTVSGDFISRLSAQYMQQYPTTTIRIKNCYTLDVIRLLKAGEADFGICTKVEDDSLHFEPLFHQDFVVIVPPDHPLADQSSIQVKMLATYPLIGYTATLPIAKMVDTLFLEQQVQPQVILRYDDEILIGGMVMQGMGIGVVAHTPFLKQYPLKVIPLEGSRQDLRMIYLAYLKDRHQSVSEKRLIQMILAQRQDSFLESEKAAVKRKIMV